MNQSTDFQTIILKLQHFWADHGCLLWQPYYTQVGAGTMNPATFLRVLGPEPWNVGYVEPSVRPDDGRYGENPNRFQLHYQFQVILKPDPGNPQELYIESLKAIGIDPRQHDIRFVEDNWEQPAIAAWGLGWEVWLDGQEITQFTYFQQVGGLTLDPVAVEMTYGLDRILIAINNASAIWTEPWGPGVAYGEVRRQEEFEHSKYYFEIADVERARQMFSLFESEAEACLAHGLVVPAHDYVLKCSHTFNILDARGAIGVTERQAFFSRMRDLARRVAETYLEQRQRLEYPLLKGAGEQGPRVEGRGAKSEGREVVSGSVPLLLEIGTEELPAGDVEAALEQLRARVPALLDDLRLAHGEVTIYATPRRLVVYVANLAARQADREDVVKGPPASRAFDALGQPTQAALGFARGKGVEVADLQTRQIDGGSYVIAVVKQTGKPTPAVLIQALPELVANIKFEKSMRWNAANVPFSRPLRWIVALLGNQVIPFDYAGVAAGQVTRGLRPNDSPEILVPSADRYFEVIEEAGILLDPQVRQAAIIEQVNQLAASVGGKARIEPGLLAEVTHLVEKPTALLGSFNPEFLSLPEDVLISVMKKHQRYFPVYKGDKLLPHFIVIRNGDNQFLELVRQGNEHVLGARFADANFFVREDIKQPLEAYRPRLSKLIFQTRLGSMLDKADRIEKLTTVLIPKLGLSEAEHPHILRAAHLCKADLTTHMVIEMTSLQGIIGCEYALRSGESVEVATAIGEQYQTAPKTRIGMGIALADRLDSLAGLFAAGLAPTGAKDPFGLRRTALGVVQSLIAQDLDFDLRPALQTAAGLLPIPAANQEACLEFIVERLRNFLLEQGSRYDVVDAVVTTQGHNPAWVAQAVKALLDWVSRSDWNMILPAYARCVRITRDQKTRFVVNPEAFAEPAEKGLFLALQIAEAAPRAPGSVNDFLNAFLPMIPAVNRFFDDVLVMAEEPIVRQNRLGMLQRIAALADGVADMTKLEGF